jgi:hypothetical protein
VRLGKNPQGPDTTSGSDGFLWNGKQMIDLGGLYPTGINGSRQIAGTRGPNPGQHACLLSNGKLTQLPNPTSFAAYKCGAGSVNNSGQILGGCDDTSSYSHGWCGETAPPPTSTRSAALRPVPLPLTISGRSSGGARPAPTPSTRSYEATAR